MVKKNSRLITLITIITCLFVPVNSIVNLIWRNIIYPSYDLYNSILPNDYVNLLFGTPVLLVFAILTLRRNKSGYIGYAGSLLFVFYNEIACLLSVRNTYSTIMNALIILLVIIALTHLFISPDYLKNLSAARPIRHPNVYGCILVIMGLLFVVRAIVNIFNVFIGITVMTLPDIGVSIADLITCSFWIISGILLFRKAIVGYILISISYFHGSMPFIALLIFMGLQPVLCGTGFVTADFIVIMIMSLILLVPFVLLNFTGLKEIE